MMPEPRKTPGPDDDEPVDPDIALITDYLANELPVAEVKAVEDRLLADEVFYEKVRPITTMWTLPASLRPANESDSP